ncbi:MAG: peptide chain release factor 1 [Myxococcota bacterium]
MLERKLDEVEARWEELGSLMGDPEIAGDAARYREVARQHGELAETVGAWRDLKRARADLAHARVLLEDRDADMREMAKAEIASIEPTIAELEARIRVLLLPRDPNDARDVILEIRAGTGGDEASLFAADLFRMYSRFAESQRWKVEILSSSASEVGGFKEVIAQVAGERVYSRLKYEAGVHRVQRVPVTEAQGRIHTSACTVAVMPEADEVEVQIGPNDLRIDVYRSSGHGGQSVNTTDSAVRITHLPTGLVVTCQDERSQLKNKGRAMKVLMSRLLEMERTRAHSAEADARRSQVGTGDRSERIRTYNFPQNRLTDHRIGLTLYNLDQVIEGPALGEVIDACVAAFQAEALRREQEEA